MQSDFYSHRNIGHKGTQYLQIPLSNGISRYISPIFQTMTQITNYKTFLYYIFIFALII